MEHHNNGSLEFPKIKVFISHSWADKQLADQLVHDLEELGAEVWIDIRNLRPGDSIQNTIDDALEQMDLVLVIWTAHSKRSKGVQAEINKCLDLGLRVVPCFIDYDNKGNPSPPLSQRLRKILGVDFHHYGTGLATLAQFILEMQDEQLPPEVEMGEQSGMRMLHLLKGYLAYLSTYGSFEALRTNARIG